MPCDDGTLQLYFYPRSPCGERHHGTNSGTNSSIFLSTLSLRRATSHWAFKGSSKSISIHALLAESDVKSFMRNGFFLISIHALLAESDPFWAFRTRWEPDFYPRSPCGERQPSKPSRRFSTPFLSTLSLRRATPRLSRVVPTPIFLSTLSLRRATRTVALTIFRG